MQEKILIIEDEEKIARFVELELQYEGYKVEKAFDGRRGLEVFSSGSFDLVLLDIMLPGLNGMDVLRRIRNTSDVPVIMLTARDAVMDRVSGLDGGADDYITKPFAIEELLARIRVALRKKSEPAEPASTTSIAIGPLALDSASYTVTVGGRPVSLTKREFDLLHYLMQNKDIVLSRESLLSKVWGFDYQGETNVVDVYIRYLRSKIDQPYGLKLIHTVRGVGYVIKNGE